MEQSSETAYVIYVMQYFSCDKEMAELIIKSYKANGELTTIQNLCNIERRDK